VERSPPNPHCGMREWRLLLPWTRICILVTRPPFSADRPGRIAGVLSRIRDAPSPLTVREATVACASVLAVVILGAGLRLACGPDASTMPAWKIGGDFPQFYIAGRLLNDQQGSRLYDSSVRESLYPELVPRDSSLRLPFNYPPFIAALFPPLARLSLPAATLVFLGITPLIYAAGMWLLICRFGWPPIGQRLLGVLGALSFAPFILYTWLGAQISVIGFCAVAIALCEEDRGRPFIAGMALSVCLYKPSLLLLLLPMLVVTRRLRILAGLATGAILLALASVAVVGPQACASFMERMMWWGRLSNLNSTPFHPLRYVDLRSFLRLAGVENPLALASVVTVGAVIPGLLLVRAWLRDRAAGRDARLLTWAATLIWGLVLNVYTPFYDCILVVPACVVAAAAIRPAYGSLRHRWLGGMFVLLYFAPWIAEIVARGTHVQPYTLVLAAFGAVTLILLSDLRRGVGAPLSETIR
jgi:hypothetical protein